LTEPPLLKLEGLDRKLGEITGDG
jgi:hypothetical protein